jgi:hypothetical protein
MRPRSITGVSSCAREIQKEPSIVTTFRIVGRFAAGRGGDDVDGSRSGEGDLHK